jgi:hypothetical protein
MLCPFAKGREARHRQKQGRPRSQRCYPFGRGRQGRAGDHHATWLPLPLLFLKALGAEALRQIKKMAGAPNSRLAPKPGRGATAAIPPCNHPLSQPYDMYGAPDVGADFKK